MSRPADTEIDDRRLAVEPRPTLTGRIASRRYGEALAAGLVGTIHQWTAVC